jgi:asparagine synthase (glutamine-hydrolysing)
MSRAGVEPIKTFSLGYEDPTFSEIEYARLIADQFHTDHHVLIIDPVTPDLVEEAVWHLDEPMSELSTVPFYLICKKAREHVTICLSGDGADEVLVGYDRFLASKANAFYSLLPRFVRHGIVGPLVNAIPDQPQKKGAFNILKRLIEGGLLPKQAGHMRWQYFGTPAQDRDLFSPDILSEVILDPFASIRSIAAQCNSSKRLDREIYVDLKLPMPEITLMKVDRMSMAHGLEVRVPFLDHEFVEFCATIPGNLKLKGFNTKHIFRSAMRGILPSTILNRGKQGFSIPIKNWLRNEMRVYMQDVLGSSPLIKSAFNTDHIQQLVREHMDYRANHNHVLWALINLAVWHRQFVESPIPSADKVTSMPATQVNIMERVLE